MSMTRDSATSGAGPGPVPRISIIVPALNGMRTGLNRASRASRSGATVLSVAFTSTDGGGC